MGQTLRNFNTYWFYRRGGLHEVARNHGQEVTKVIVTFVTFFFPRKWIWKTGSSAAGKPPKLK